VEKSEVALALLEWKKTGVDQHPAEWVVILCGAKPAHAVGAQEAVRGGFFFGVNLDFGFHFFAGFLSR
jgi:hypothetical protein